MNSAEKAQKLVKKAQKDAAKREVEAQKIREEKEAELKLWAKTKAEELLQPILKTILNNAKSYNPQKRWSYAHEHYYQDPLAYIPVMSHLDIGSEENKWGEVTHCLKTLIEAEGFRVEISYDSGEARGHDDYDIGASYALNVYLPEELK